MRSAALASRRQGSAGEWEQEGPLSSGYLAQSGAAENRV